MCGLVFCGGRSALSVTDIELFEKFLQCDTYRGDHSTGVCSWFTPWGKDPFYKVAKAAIDGFDFVKSHWWESVSKQEEETYFKTPTFMRPKMLFGHNRYATQGAITAKNAHPFHHGNIILAHNGTLTNRTKLPEHQNFEVDSENICYSIATIGAEETIKNLIGAFTLIWLDTEAKTLNIIRNSQRPFHLFECVSGDWYGCSEKDMGLWLINRPKSGARIKRNFEAEVGVQYVFDVSNGCVLREEIKRELYTFPTTQGAGYYGRWGEEAEAEYEAWWNDRSHYNRAKTTTTASKETSSGTGDLNKAFRDKVSKIFNDVGLEGITLGSKLSFQMYEYTPYPKKLGYGRVTGWVPDILDFFEVQVNDVLEGEFEIDKNAYVEVISAFESKGTVTVIAKVCPNGKFFPLDGEKKVDPPSDDRVTLLSGETFTWSEWVVSEHARCSKCNGHILYSQASTATIKDGKCVCEDCMEDQDFSFLDKLDDSIVETRGTLTGERFTECEWEKSIHNCCALCGNPIKFEEVETCRIEHGYCFCGDCVAESEKGEADEPEEKHPWCTVCGRGHGTDVIEGTMAPAVWTSLAVNCPYKIKYRDKFTSKRPVLSLVNKSKEVVKEGDSKTFLDSIGVSEEPTTKVIPVGSGMRVTKTNWEQMNGCRVCGKKIPWGLAEYVEFWGSAPMCPCCSDALDEKERQSR